jgi:hypothetical protein
MFQKIFEKSENRLVFVIFHFGMLYLIRIV